MKNIGISVLLSIITLVASAQYPGEKVYAPDPGSGSYFGMGVALEGDYALIGAGGAYNALTGDNNAGVAYFFKRTDGQWVFLQKMAEPEIRYFDGYGSCVDLDPEYAVVSAPRWGTGGTAFVYKKVDDLWERQLQLPSYSNSEYGTSVAISGDHIAIGAPTKGNGTVLIYSKTVENETETWTETAKLTPNDSYVSEHFGCDVDISGACIAVSAWTGYSAYYGRSAAYVFEFENGSWRQTQRLFPKDTDTTTNHFGKCVSVSGNIIAVTAPEEENDDAVKGAVYIFEKTAGGWGETAKLISPDKNFFHNFGRSVELSGNKLIVGALDAVYIYEKVNSTWVLIDYVHNKYSNHGYIYEMFGYSVSLSDSLFLVGAYDDCDFSTLAGAVHFYKVTDDLYAGIQTMVPSESISVFPNPVTHILNIHSVQNICRIKLSNSAGVTVRSLQYEEPYTGQVFLDLTDLSPGIYYLSMFDKNNDVLTLTVIKT